MVGAWKTFGSNAERRRPATCASAARACSTADTRDSRVPALRPNASGTGFALAFAHVPPPHPLFLAILFGKHTQHGPQRQEVATHTARGHVEARGTSPVKEEGIAAFQFVAEEPRKGSKGHLALGNGEYNRVWRTHTDAVARFKG